MRIETINGVLTAKAESVPDIETLLKLESNKAPVAMLKCNKCGLPCRGRIGLGIHMSTAHGVRSPQYKGDKKEEENSTPTA